MKATEGIQSYDVNRDATRQEMRAYVCGQCHVEYSMGFHADQEAMRILALAIDEARRGQAALPGSVASGGE